MKRNPFSRTTSERPPLEPQRTDQHDQAAETTRPLHTTSREEEEARRQKARIRQAGKRIIKRDISNIGQALDRVTPLLASDATNEFAHNAMSHAAASLIVQPLRGFETTFAPHEKHLAAPIRRPEALAPAEIREPLDQARSAIRTLVEEVRADAADIDDAPSRNTEIER